MNKFYVTKEIAEKLRAKGYNVEEIHYENSSWSIDEVYQTDNLRIYKLPRIDEVLAWLRVEKKIFIAINIGYCYESYEKPFPTNPKMEPILKGYYYGIWELDNLNDKNALSRYFEAPEQAAIAGIEFYLDNLI